MEGIKDNNDRRRDIIRGRKIITYDEARSYSRTRLPSHDWGVFWGGLYIPSEEAASFAVLGIPGSGKTTIIRQMMESVFRLIGLEDKSKGRALLVDPEYYSPRYISSHPERFPPKKESHRALVYDIKPEYLAYIHGMDMNCEVVTLDPFNANGWGWDIGKDVNSDAMAALFAEVLIPEKKTSDNSEFFRSAARDVVAPVH